MALEMLARIINTVAPYTMTDATRIAGLVREVERVVKEGIPGHIVECGVWRGGSMMAVAMRLLELGVTDRELYLFDTFSGMTAPEPVDMDLYGRSAMDPKAGAYDPRGCAVSLADVQAAMSTVGYPPEQICYVKGPVEETLPAKAPKQIALLHLDTDWYRSTRHELETLFPRVSPGGCIMFDDYGHWQGAHKAVDEYLEGLVPRPTLEPCGYTAVILRKP